MARFKVEFEANDLKSLGDQLMLFGPIVGVESEEEVLSKKPAAKKKAAVKGGRKNAKSKAEEPATEEVEEDPFSGDEDEPAENLTSHQDVINVCNRIMEVDKKHSAKIMEVLETAKVKKIKHIPEHLLGKVYDMLTEFANELEECED